MIDVMLVLLIMFIITLPVRTHNTSIQMPHPPGPDAIVPPEAIEVAIEFDGTILLHGAVVESLEQLEHYFRGEAARPEPPELHLRPDRRAKYDVVAKVLSTAQRSGMKRIGFAGQEQYLDETLR